jgi:hypothetical protein
VDKYAKNPRGLKDTASEGLVKELELDISGEVNMARRQIFIRAGEIKSGHAYTDDIVKLVKRIPWDRDAAFCSNAQFTVAD